MAEIEPQKSEAKIIALNSPKEGAGKTTLTLNLALDQLHGYRLPAF